MGEGKLFLLYIPGQRESLISTIQNSSVADPDPVFLGHTDPGPVKKTVPEPGP